MMRKDVYKYMLSISEPRAQVCEKLGRHGDALLYAAKVRRYDPSAGGGEADARQRSDDMRPTTHAAADALRGRALARLGRAEEAEAAFEEAAGVASGHGLWLLEMLALRDLKLHVLDKAAGRGVEAGARLKAVLSKMKGPSSELTKLLGGDLDAEEFMRL
jgi:tetratricopeptide (TPR) repeat protein